MHMAKRTRPQKIPVPVPPRYEPSVLTMPSGRPRRFTWRWVLGALVILLVILTAANKGWVVAAIVDGRPIFSWQLNSMLRTRYGQQTLEGMIGETLIAKEAKHVGVAITDEDIKAKQTEILSSLGTEVSLTDFLKFQGLSQADFNQQLKIQLTVERLLTRDLAITEHNIDNYIATNRAILTATEPAGLREEAKKAIISNTVSEKLQPWFLELRQKANVMKFL